MQSCCTEQCSQAQWPTYLRIHPPGLPFVCAAEVFFVVADAAPTLNVMAPLSVPSGQPHAAAGDSLFASSVKASLHLLSFQVLLRWPDAQFGNNLTYM
jgi:hypothetical protein